MFVQRSRPKMKQSELTEVYEFAKSLALECGKEIKLASDKRWAGSAALDTKMNSVDLVTETDQRVEKMVIESIKKRFPSHQFCGEESTAAGETHVLDDRPTWIVDPIDGTTNFVHFFAVCISIGFCVNKEPVIGIINCPFLNIMYHGMKGHGSFQNETRLPLSGPSPPALPSLSNALIGVEWGSLRSKEVMQKKQASFSKLVGDPESIPGGLMAHSLRSLGSAAINFCCVAAGQMDMYWEIGCYSWDVCAGAVIAREAGGRCYGRNASKNFDLDGRHYFVIRGMEGGEEAQDKLAKQFFETITDWDP